MSIPPLSPQRVDSGLVEDQLRRLVDAASALGWSGDRTKSLTAREALLLGGSLSVPIVLTAVTAFPRADVQAEAIGILKSIAEQGV